MDTQPLFGSRNLLFQLLCMRPELVFRLLTRFAFFGSRLFRFLQSFVQFLLG